PILRLPMIPANAVRSLTIHRRSLQVIAGLSNARHLAAAFSPLALLQCPARAHRGPVVRSPSLSKTLSRLLLPAFKASILQARRSPPPARTPRAARTPTAT